uniref:SAM-dependent methyltransferase n=1 Tax=Actinomadura rubrobrunea TaxID=115335 RepID=UPI000836B056
MFRTNQEILNLFDGFTLEEPGLVPVEDWRPDPRFAPDLSTIGGDTATLVQGVGAVGVLQAASETG